MLGRFAPSLARSVEAPSRPIQPPLLNLGRVSIAPPGLRLPRSGLHAIDPRLLPRCSIAQADAASSSPRSNTPRPRQHQLRRSVSTTPIRHAPRDPTRLSHPTEASSSASTSPCTSRNSARGPHGSRPRLHCTAPTSPRSTLSSTTTETRLSVHHRCIITRTQLNRSTRRD